jgi:hypothetical protein
MKPLCVFLFCLTSAILAAAPKEVPKQGEGDWVDARYAKVKFGPFVSGHIATPKGGTHKGIAIRVGEKGEGTMVFDTDLCTWRAGWTGGFLKTDPARYGLIRALKPVGDIIYTRSPLPGGAKHFSFQDPRNPKNGPLPRDWMEYRGVFLNGKRVVLEYSLGKTRILDSPWLVDGKGVMIREIQTDAFTGQLILGVCEEKSGKWREDDIISDGGDAPIGLMIVNENKGKVLAVAVVRSGITADLDYNPKGQAMINIWGEGRPVKVKLFIWRGLGNQLDNFKKTVVRHKKMSDLGAMIKAGPLRWGDPIVTKGIVDQRKIPFAIDTIAVPYKNRFNALFFTAGHDFTSNGDCYVATAHGDVWKVTGIDAELKAVKWHRFATGLYQPLGLRVVKDKVYVLGRDQITRLHDKNGDGEADFYEAFNNDIMIGGGGHAYATCLETDPAGNFYFIRCAEGTPHGGVLLKVTADGSKLSVVATGFRNPNGLGVGPNAVITAADQQGTWVPETRLDVIRPGGFYGFMPSHKRKVAPTTYDPPLMWIPRVLDNSAGGQVWVPKGKWGPLGGELLHFSYGRCTMMHIVRDGANGGAVPLGGRFLSGACRGRFNPKDGHLYVTGLLGWQTSAIRDGCLQRVRFTGEPIRQPIGMKIHANGIRLTFSTALGKKIAEDIDSWSAEQWNYKWTKNYGSKDWSVKNPKKIGRDPIAIQSAKLLPDGKSVFLQIAKVAPVHSMAIQYNLDTAKGKIFKGTYYLTVNEVGKALEK